MGAKAGRRQVAAGDLSAITDAMAAEVRVHYVAAYRMAHLLRHGVASSYGAKPMPRWDGGESEDGYRAPIWPRIAALCVAHGAEPAVWVRAQFEDREDPPRPNQLLGDRAAERYRAFAAGRDAALRDALRAQKQSLALRAGRLEADYDVPREAAVERTLRATDIGLSGLFRYCFAAQWGRREIAARFRDAALRQYAFERAAYDAAWGDFVPEELRRAADDLQRAIGIGGSRG